MASIPSPVAKLSTFRSSRWSFFIGLSGVGGNGGAADVRIAAAGPPAGDPAGAVPALGASAERAERGPVRRDRAAGVRRRRRGGEAVYRQAVEVELLHGRLGG